MLSAYFTTQIYALMQIVMSCFSYGGEDTRRLIALAFLCRPPNTPAKTKTPHTNTPPLGAQKKRAPHRRPPTQKNCGSHLLSHTHQDAVPSTPQGLAHQVRKGYWAFPPSYHHRKTTKQQPTPQKRGPACCFKTIQRTQTPQTTIV